MKNRAFKGLITLFIAFAMTSTAFGNVGTAAGQLLRKVFSQTDFIAKQSLRLSDDVATEFMGNISIVKQLLNGFEGADDAAKASNFVKSIKNSIDAEDTARYDQLKNLVSENSITPDEARQLHDLLVYFSYRYTTSSKPIMMYCILCQSGSGFADAAFSFTFKNTENVPFNGMITDINQKTLKEVQDDIVDIMRNKLKFENFNFSQNSNLQPGQEHAFLLFLRITNSRSRSDAMKPFKEYGKAVKELAAQVSKDSGEFFGNANPNRFHLMMQEVIDVASNPNANATPEQVIGTWTAVINDTKQILKEDPSQDLYGAFEEAIKRDLRDSKGNIDQNVLDEVNGILNRCKFVSRAS